MRVALLTFALSACFDNAAEDYAHMLAAQDKKTPICFGLSKGGYGDMALCRLDDEEWFCQSEPRRCRVLGPDVRLQRVR